MISTLFGLLLSLSFAQTFERPCFVAGDDDFLDSKVQITGADWTIIHTAFTDQNCQEPYLIFSVKSKAKILGDELDLQVQEVSYISTLDIVTRALNEIGFCNQQDWKTGVRQIVTGEQCQDYSAPKENELIYSTFELSQSPTRLRMGEATATANGKTPDKRHTQLEDLPYFLR